MASVLAHLLTTMPFEAGVSYGMAKLAVTRKSEAAERKKTPSVKSTRGLVTPVAQPTTTPDESIPFEVFNLIQPLAKGDWPVFAPSKPKAPSDATKEHEKLWSFKHDASKPHEVTRITCRVRESDYRRYEVLESLRFGCESAGTHKPEVRVVTEAGAELALPLDADHLYGRFVVHGGLLNGESTWKSPRYPLAASIDKGLVVAFAFDIGPKNEITPYRPSSTDKGHAALEEWIGRWQKKPLRDEPKDRWLDRALAGDFMPLPLESDPLLPQLRVGVDDVGTVKVAPPRVLVTIAFTTCKERANFEPVGVVGMARLYPHLMVRASVKLRSVHGSARFQRPTKTTVHLDKGETPMAGPCCGAKETIGSILVSDANYGSKWFDPTLPIGPDMFYLPYWGALFGYYMADPDKAKDDKKKAVAGQALRVVDRSKGERGLTGCGTRILPERWQKLDTIYKVARQGEFDNIHVAPRLSQTAPQAWVKGQAGLASRPPSELVTVDPVLMRTEEIAMAPFCSHDCFHLHWRWSSVSDEPWTKGYGDNIPMQKVGAPLIPASHDLDFTAWGPGEFTLTEHAMPTATPTDDTVKSIKALAMSTFFDFGAAYAQGTSSMFLVAAMKLRMMSGSDSVTFVAKDGTGLAVFEDPPTTYWNLRYYGQVGKDGKARAIEWIQMTPADVDKARRG